MTAFKMYDCDFGFTYNGVNYQFTHVDSFVIEDPETTRIIRGANAGNKEGLTYVEGLKEPKTFTVTILGVTAEIHNLLKTIYKDKTRIDVFAISRADGSSKIGKNAVMMQSPKQLTMDDSADSLGMSLQFATFDIEEDHKT